MTTKPKEAATMTQSQVERPACESVKCGMPAMAEVFWPGKEPLKMCNTCVARARGVMAALGYHVVVRPLSGFTEVEVRP